MPRSTDPGSDQLVFKPQHQKLTTSRNALRGCLYCGKRRTPDTPPLRVCGACRAAEYCSREHQKAHWKDHKDICRQKQALNTIGAQQPTEGSDIPPIPTKLRMLQDWCSLHRYILRRAVSFAYLKTNRKLNTDNQHIFLQVSFRPDYDGNPAKAFTLDGGKIEDDPSPNTPEGRNLESFKATTTRKTAEMRAEDPDLISWLRCMILVDSNTNVTFGWSTALPVYRSMLDSLLPTGFPPPPIWIGEAKHCAENGYVYRLVKDKKLRIEDWEPGVMEEETPGGNWVWQKRTRDELGVV